MIIEVCAAFLAMQVREIEKYFKKEKGILEHITQLQS